MSNTSKVAVIMGSDSDYPTVKNTLAVLKKFDIEFTVNVISAHRTPDKAADFAKNADKNGYDLIIAAAGKAAHLPGVLAAFTVLPVIGSPVKSSTLDGLDSLLSIVQMPNGIPVATVAVDGADNAGILAAQMLALKYSYLKDKLYDFKKSLEDGVAKKDAALQEKVLDDFK